MVRETDKIFDVVREGLFEDINVRVGHQVIPAGTVIGGIRFDIPLDVLWLDFPKVQDANGRAVWTSFRLHSEIPLDDDLEQWFDRRLPLASRALREHVYQLFLEVQTAQ